MADWGAETASWDGGAPAAPSGGDAGEWGAETQEEVDARMEKQLFGEVRQGGIDFDVYNKIAVNVEDSGTPCPAPARDFKDMGMAEGLLANIQRMNYKDPTPIQKVGVPIALTGRDLMACAQTGSGKTGAFMFAIITRLLPLLTEERKAAVASSASLECAIPMALIITPTRELAIQIKTEAQKFSFKMPLKACVAYGGQPRGTQIRDMMTGCDILIATPGRLCDFLDGAKVALKAIQVLVLDEADRMLDMGFEADIAKVVNEVDMPKEKQTLMFSATFGEDEKAMAQNYLTNAAFVSIGRVGSSTDLITQQLIRVEDSEKKDKLMELIQTHAAAKRVLVFVERKSTAVDLDAYLDGAGIYATSIHGDRDQVSRETALNNFSRGLYFLLVATDVAARGLDVDGIDVVINFDMPNNLDSYTHRIGRTGRAGRRGLAISFINSRTNAKVLQEVQTLMEECEQKKPEFLSEMIVAAEEGGGRDNGCNQWKQGTCTRGEDCRFEHIGEAGTPPEGFEGGFGGGGGGRDNSCHAWGRGDCSRGDDCRFDHVGEAGSGGGDNSCRQWSRGECTRGDSCRFDHVGEGGTAPGGGGGFGGGGGECRQWTRGECTRGDSCRFEHVGPGVEGAGGDSGFGGGGFGGGSSGGFDDQKQGGGDSFASAW